MNDTATTSKGTSPWVFIGIGCGLAILLLIAAVVGVGFFLHRTAKKFENDLRDPATREAKVKQILGCSELPEGYKPSVSFSIPWFLDVAMLSDVDLKLDHQHKPFDKHGFIYVRTLRGRGGKRAKDYFDGTADPEDFLSRSKIDMTKGREIARGTIPRDDLTLYYIAHEGSIRMEGERVEGIATMMFLDCKGDSKFRMGIWFGPRPEGEHASGGTLSGGDRGDEGAKGPASEPGGGKAAGPAPAEYAGTPADEAAIREFMSHFSPCGS